MLRLLSYVAMAVVAAVALALGALGERGSATVEDRVENLASSIRCPQCRSQSVNDSEASTAQAARREIAERVEAGESDDEIRGYFASRYGAEILLRPPSTGVGSLVWVVPVVAFVVGAAGLTLAFRNWRRWA